MPREYSWRQPQILEMHATLVEVPEGEDTIECLTKKAEKVRCMPLLIFSDVGMSSRAVLNVPNDEALAEILDRTDTFGVEKNPDEEAIRKFNTYEHVKVDDLPEESLDKLRKMVQNFKGMKPKPH